MVSGYQFAGLEYGAECHCGNRISSPRVPEEDCSLMCRGERGSPCGGVGRLSIYKVEEQLPGHRKCECLLFILWETSHPSPGISRGFSTQILQTKQ